MSPLYEALDPVADAVNPLLALVTILAAVLDWRAGRKRRMLVRAIPTALGLACIYAVGFVDRGLQLWSRVHGDYSTHTAFATTLTVSLLLWRPGWRVALLTVWSLYLVLIVMIGYHSLADVLSAAVVAVVVTLPWHVAARRFHG